MPLPLRRFPLVYSGDRLCFFPHTKPVPGDRRGIHLFAQMRVLLEKGSKAAVRRKHQDGHSREVGSRNSFASISLYMMGKKVLGKKDICGLWEVSYEAGQLDFARVESILLD